MIKNEQLIQEYLSKIGIPATTPLLIPFDPGYDPNTLSGHLEQSNHLMKCFKISMATWMVCDIGSLEKKMHILKKYPIPIIAGGGPFEIANAKGVVEDYFHLCKSIGFDIIEVSNGFTDNAIDSKYIFSLAKDYDVRIQYEIGRKYEGTLDTGTLDKQINTGKSWLDQGAQYIVIEALESAHNVGIFDTDGNLISKVVDQILKAFNNNFENLVFEAPTKSSQFQLIDYLGEKVILSNIRLEEILRVHIYRLGLHSKSFR
ncbi:MAG: hypothetical protein RL641_258 [Candidatus Parcubacteria bacterium]|jgi:phosphosulfolactate synthase